MHLNKVGEHKQMVLIGFFSFTKLFCHFRVRNSYLRVFLGGLYLTSEVSIFGSKTSSNVASVKKVAALQAVAQVTQVGVIPGMVN